MSQLVTVRFPNAAAEYQLTETTPKVGDVLRRNGDSWVVQEVTQEKDGTSTVTLRARTKPVAPSEGA